MLKETDHDYQGALCGNYYNSKETTMFVNSWNDFKDKWLGFRGGSIEDYDDTYHFIFRFDIDKKDDLYRITLCNMLQRKGIYCFIVINNVSQKELDGEVREWLKQRKQYMNDLWKEI